MLHSDEMSEIPAAVPPYAQIRLLLMPGEVFDRAQAGTVFANHRGGLGTDLLICYRFKKFAHPKTTRVTSGLLCRQRMVRSNHFVAVCDIGFLAQEQRAVVGHPIQE